jgi:hypothetical protein
MVETIVSLSDEKTFEGGYQFLMQWFRKHVGTTSPLAIPIPIDDTSSPLVLDATPVSIQNNTTTSTQPKIKAVTVDSDTDSDIDSDILEVYENTSQTQTTKLPFKAQLFLSVRPGEFPPLFELSLMCQGMATVATMRSIWACWTWAFSQEISVPSQG